MTEEEAQAWVIERFGAATHERLAKFAAAVIEENQRQNLISPASIPQIWQRHIVDSLQLIPLAGPGPWLDIGTGGGFPGLVIALAGCCPVTMLEPRRKRAEFLDRCVSCFHLREAVVSTARVETVAMSAAVISARAVAPLEKLLHVALHCGTSATRWLLPRGTVDHDALVVVARQFGMVFHVEQSVTQAGSAIVVLSRR